MKTELTVTGMTCGHCQKAVQQALAQLPGVEQAEVDLARGLATVTGTAELPALIAAVTEEGYAASPAHGA